MTGRDAGHAAEREPGADHRLRRVLRVRGVTSDARVWPLVQDLASELTLSGTGHDENGTLVLEVQGESADVERFGERIAGLLPAARTSPVVSRLDTNPEPGGGFLVSGGALPSPLPADLGPCPACRAELADLDNRRYRHAFIACTECGPRASLVTGPPADRQHSTMAGFPMCQPCVREDADEKDRRHHALGTSCPDCGPLLEFVEAGSGAQQKAPARGVEAMARARGMLRGGAIVAVKGPGGYHLACDAGNPSAVRRLRARRAQGDRPFALLVADVASARAIVDVTDAEAELLESARRPVVMLPRRQTPSDQTVRVSEGVAPRLHEWGVMLPPSALHVLLLGLPEDPPGPRALVLTSAGRGDEPMLTDDAEASEQLSGVADAWLRHDREINLPAADSIVRMVDGELVPIRWARGYTPMPLALPVAVDPALALGGDRDNAICLAEGYQAWIAPQAGTIDEHSSQRAFERTIPYLNTLAGLVPTTLVADQHPGYRSAQWAVREVVRRVTEGGPRPKLARAQQQHAHVAAVMADNGLDGSRPVIGFAFGGTGFGEDQAVWGGEALIADYDGFHRFARLAYVPLPGDEELVLQRPYRMALSHMAAAGVPWDGRLLSVAATPVAERQLLDSELAGGLLKTQTSSMRLLVDAVASLTGICHQAGYDGQAAAELEAQARAGLGHDHVSYTLPLMEGPAGEPRLWDPGPLVTTIARDIAGGAPARIVAARFHRALAHAVLEVARLARQETLIRTVALSGELFGDVVLLRLSTRALRADGFTVLWPRRVPPGDGGLSLGQLMIGARRS